MLLVPWLAGYFLALAPVTVLLTTIEELCNENNFGTIDFKYKTRIILENDTKYCLTYSDFPVFGTVSWAFMKEICPSKFKNQTEIVNTLPRKDLSHHYNDIKLIYYGTSANQSQCQLFNGTGASLIIEPCDAHKNETVGLVCILSIGKQLFFVSPGFKPIVCLTINSAKN